MQDNPLKKYTNIEQIGKGGEGDVYRAYDTNLRQYVVLKRFKNTSGTRKEVDTLKNLHHSNLPHVLDYLETPYGTFTVMNYIEGDTLRDLIAQGRTFRREELIRWSKELCGALEYMHTREIPIIHGDIKPSNIMLTPKGELFLIDFGIASYLGGEVTRGFSPGYSSPEQYQRANAPTLMLRNQWIVDQRSDIYSLGATLYYLVTGRKHTDFNKTPDRRLLEQQMGKPFAAIILKAMSNNRGDRYASAADMLNDLEHLNEQDERYLKLLHDQKFRTTLFFVLAVFFLIGGIVCARQYNSARLEAYNAIVEDERDLIRNMNYEAAADKRDEAIEMMPREIDAYYYYAEGLYFQNNKDEECADYIETNIISNKRIGKSSKRAKVRLMDAYALQGLAYARMGKGSVAVECFEDAEEIGELSKANLRSYALALAIDGNLNAAEEKLIEATEKGESPANIMYTRGEICYETRQYDDGIEQFKGCIAETEDSDTKMRSYLMIERCYTAKGDLRKAIDSLKPALRDLGKEYQEPILNRMADDALKLREYKEGAGYIRMIIDNGNKDWHYYDQLCRACYNGDDIAGLLATADEMKDLDFDRKYRADMWASFGYYAAMDLKNGDLYYRKAMDAYMMNETEYMDDTDMDRLEEIHSQSEDLQGL